MMNAKTLTALKGSIAKWEAIVAGTGVDQGPKNCPLCVLFWKCSKPGELDTESCKGCPVMEKTGKPGCEDTPYDAFEDNELGDIDSRETAQAELDFLKSLLPGDSL